MSQQLRATQFKIDKVQKSPSGTLKVRGKLTKAGIFRYRRGEAEIRELRSEKEVFSKDALDSLEGAHVTIDHPSDFVGSDNWKIHSVGTVLSVKADPPYVEGVLSVHDARAQHMIEHGYLKEISCGYFMKPKRIDAGEADIEQTEIRYNHAALGPSGWGRLGSDVSLTLDSIGNQELFTFDLKDDDMSEEVSAKAEDKQEELQLEDHPPLRDEVRALAQKVDSILAALSKTEDKDEAPLYQELSPKPDPAEIEQKISERVHDALDLEIRARCAYEAIFPSRKLHLNNKPSAKRLCEEVLSLDSQTHELSLKELVERTEVAAVTAVRERDAKEKIEDAKWRTQLLGVPFVQSNDSGFRARILNK